MAKRADGCLFKKWSASGKRSSALEAVKKDAGMKTDTHCLISDFFFFLFRTAHILPTRI